MTEQATETQTEATSAGGSTGRQESSGGFPANTPWQDMTPAEQVSYWQHQSRRHEDRVKAIGLTPEQVKDLRDKAARHDALEREMMSDKDKAVAEATDRAKADAYATVIPKLVAAEFKAAAAGRIEAERLTTIIEPLDLAKFLTDSGDVDTEKVSRFVDGIAPAKGSDSTTTKLGPSAHGQGVRAGSSAAGASVASGRELYQQRHARRTA